MPYHFGSVWFRSEQLVSLMESAKAHQSLEVEVASLTARAQAAEQALESARSSVGSPRCINFCLICFWFIVLGVASPPQRTRDRLGQGPRQSQHSSGGRQGNQAAVSWQSVDPSLADTSPAVCLTDWSTCPQLVQPPPRKSPGCKRRSTVSGRMSTRALSAKETGIVVLASRSDQLAAVARNVDETREERRALHEKSAMHCC